MNKILILFSLGVVGVFAFWQSVSAQQATLFFSPPSQTVQPGAVFTIQVLVNTGGVQVNAVAAYFTYPADKLEVVQVDTTGSVMQFVAERSGGGGQVRIAGGSSTPGFSGVQRVGLVQFRALSSPGSAQLSWSGDSAVLTDVGNQNILSIPTSGTGVYTIQAVILPPPPTPTPLPPPPQPPLPPPSTPELAIVDIQAEKLTEDSVALSWRTSEPARGQVRYGPSTQEDYPLSVFDGTLTTEHRFVISEVNFAEEYAVELIARDVKGREIKSGRLQLSDLIKEELELPPPPPSEEEPPTREGLPFPLPILVLFGIVVLTALIVLGGMVFRRMKS